MEAKRGTAIRLGAWWGAVTWGAYAVTESALLTLRPLLQNYADYVTTAHVQFTLLFWLIYLGIGLTAGGLVALLVASLRSGGAAINPARIQAAAAATLPAAFLATAVSTRLLDFKPEETADPVLGSGLLLAVTVVAVVWPRWARPLGVAFGPWTLSLVLVGMGSWAASGGLKQWATVLAAALVTALLTRLWLDPKPGDAAPPRRHAGALAAAVPALVVAVTLSSRGLPPLPNASEPAAAGGPNIVLVVLDTVRADHMSVYGYGRPTTPFLDSLARQATLYTKALAPSNFTLPSHASIFTGLYPRAHGAIIFPCFTANARPLDRRYDTLAELLRSRGYRTLAAAANAAFVNPDYGFDQGFEVLASLKPVRFLPLNRCTLRYGLRRLLGVALPMQRLDEAFRDAARITSDALTLLGQAVASGRPIFLFLNYMDAHEPYVIPSAYEGLFPGRNPQLTYEHYSRMVREVVGLRRPITQEERNHFVSQYDGAIAFLDRQLEGLVRGLKGAGLWQNTMFIVTADHGEAFGEHNFVGHSQSLYQHQLSIPLLIRFPGQESGKTVDHPVSLVDLMPTILDLAGIPVPPNLHGRSLLRAEQFREVAVFAEEYTDLELFQLRRSHPCFQFAVFSSKNGKKLIASAGDRQELYDLERDPGERSNLVSSEPGAAEELRNRLTTWLEKTPLKVESSTQIDPKAIERLRTFGYVR